MKTLFEILIAKIFDNPIGRWYLGVPAGKHIYKITKSSAHYFTGEIAKNGLPIICTGGCSAGGRLPFIHWLENWKPIHLCWLFLKMGWRIPKYFIGADTGYKSPTATGGTYNDFTNPTNAYSSNDSYATVTSIDNAIKRQSYATFGFGVTAGATINGIEMSLEGYYSGNAPSVDRILWYCTSDVGNSSVKDIPFTGADGTFVVGSSVDLWGTTPIATDFSDANFYAFFYFRSAVAQTSNLFVDHIQVKVYYTAAGPANLKTINGLAKASVKTVNGLAIASVKTYDGLA